MPKEERRISPAVVIIPIGLGLGLVGVLAALAWAAPPTPPSGLIGDLNDDGVVDYDDLAILQSYIAGVPISEISPLSEAEFLRRADVNGDGVVNALDLTALEILIGEEEPPLPPATGMITLYATGLRTVYWPGGVILEGTPYERYLPPGNYADWYADWYYAETGRYRTNYEDYQDLTTQNDPCTPPEPIDLNNLLIRVNDYSKTEVCPATGHKGACRWGPFGPFVVEDGGVYTINITTGELREGRI